MGDENNLLFPIEQLEVFTEAVDNQRGEML